VAPFDPENRIIFGPGVLTGTPVPTASRTTVTTLCPGGTMVSPNLGEYIGTEIRHAGYDNIIIQGKADKPVYLYLHDDIVEFRDAGNVWGKKIIETQQLIKKEIGNPDAAVACIGPAGENMVSFACVRSGIQATAGRGGAGAIMGSKNLKAIAVRGKHGIEIAKMTEFLESARETSQMLMSHPVLQTPVPKMSPLAMELNDSPNKRGVSTFGNWEDVDWGEIGAENFVPSEGGVEYYNKYYIARVGCNGCPISRCYRICDDPEAGIGAAKCTTQPLFTFRVWNRDWRVMQTAGHFCNDYGMDISSTGNVIAFLMELYHRGIITEKDTDGIPMKRGDKEAIISTIHKIARQEGIGRVFRDGVVAGAREISRGAEEYAMSVKGQELGLHEFRGRRATTLVQVTSTKQGGGEYPHPETAWTIGTKRKEAVYPPSYEGKAEMVWKETNTYRMVDLLGVCKNYFSWAADRTMQPLAKLFSLATGVETSEEDLFFASQRLQVLERAFDVMHGIGRKDDVMPKRMYETVVSGGPFKGEKIEKDKFDSLLSEYYELCGWDDDGVPEKETFEKYDLESEWETFEGRLKKEDAARD
jgi:aldehyde:ferredoxin oxidoreductase